MNRTMLGVLLFSFISMFSFVTGGFILELERPIITWLGAFLIPIWSILTVSLWHDIGRKIWGKEKEVTIPTFKDSLVFITWMSLVFTYVIWVHINLYCLPMLFVIPALLFFWKEQILLWNWDNLPKLTWDGNEIFILSMWFMGALPVYWVLNIIWIAIRVYFGGDNFPEYLR